MTIWEALMLHAKRVGVFPHNHATMFIRHLQRLSLGWRLIGLIKRSIKLINNHLFPLNEVIGLRLPIPLRAKASRTKTLCNG